MILCACMVALLRSLVATNEVLNLAMHAPFLRLCTPQLIVLQDKFEGMGQGRYPFLGWMEDRWGGIDIDAQIYYYHVDHLGPRRR